MNNQTNTIEQQIETLREDIRIRRLTPQIKPHLIRLQVQKLRNLLIWTGEEGTE
jgi:hypothetical protein